VAELSRVCVVFHRKYTVTEELKPVFFVCNDSRPFIGWLCNVLHEVHYGIAAAFRCIGTSEF